MEYKLREFKQRRFRAMHVNRNSEFDLEKKVCAQ